MGTYFTLINRPKGNKGISRLVRTINGNFAREYFYFIVAASEEDALYIEKIANGFHYYDNFTDIIDVLIYGGNICTTNDVFIKVIEKSKFFIDQERILNHRLIVNDRLPWLEHLPDGGIKCGVAPVFSEYFNNNITVMTDSYNGSELQKYCNINGFKARTGCIFN